MRRRMLGGLPNALQQIAGVDGAHSPFLTHVAQWESTLPKTKTRAAWLTNLREFDQVVGQPLDRLSRSLRPKMNSRTCWGAVRRNAQPPSDISW